MVSGKVIVKKRFGFGKLVLAVLGVALAAGIIYSAFFLGAVFGKGPGEAAVTYENPLTELLAQYAAAGIEINQEELINQAELEFDQNYINYALFAMSAWKLHKPPFSSDTPKIKIILDEDDIYYSEIIDSAITTQKSSIGEPDIAIISDKKEIIQAMLAPGTAEFMKTSVAEARTKIEMIASIVKLAGKGYLQMYEEITGESLIGSVIKEWG